MVIVSRRSLVVLAVFLWLLAGGLAWIRSLPGNGWVFVPAAGLPGILSLYILVNGREIAWVLGGVGLACIVGAAVWRRRPHPTLTK